MASGIRSQSWAPEPECRILLFGVVSGALQQSPHRNSQPKVRTTSASKAQDFYPAGLLRGCRRNPCILGAIPLPRRPHSARLPSRRTQLSSFMESRAREPIRSLPEPIYRGLLQSMRLQRPTASVRGMVFAGEPST